MTLEEAKTVVHRVARLMKLGGVPAIHIYNRKRGFAHPGQGWFSVPKRAMVQHPAYATAYIIHEMTHFGNPRSYNYRAAGPCTIYRGKAYLSGIRDLKSGQDLCDRFGNAPQSAVIDYQI